MTLPADPKRRCKAHNRKGKQCGRPAVPGALVCEYHGGAAPQVQAAAQRRLTLHEAEQAARQLGLLIDISPEQVLLDEVQRCAGMVAFYQRQVEQIANVSAQDLVWGQTKQKIGGDDRGETYEAAPNVWLQLFNAERDRLTRVCAAALRAGIEERRVKLAEGQGVLIASVLKRILDQMLRTVVTVVPKSEDALVQAWSSAVAEVVPRELRALTA